MSHAKDSSTLKLKWLIGTGLVLVVFLVWIEGGFVSKTEPGLGEEKTPPQTGERFRVQRQPTEDTLTWPARIEALKTIELAPKQPGRILEINATPGTQVQRGQVLVRLEGSDLEARLAQARAQLDGAQAEAVRAAADAHRLRNLHAKEAATRQSLDVALAAERQSQAKVQEMRQWVRQTEAQLAETVIRAPFDGVIDRRLREPGDMGLPGQPVLSFLHLPVLRLEAQIPARCVQGMNRGDVLTAATRDAVGSIEAVIEELAPASDPLTETVKIKARLTLVPDPAPIPGTFVWLNRSCRTDALLLIPARGVTRIGQLESVRVFQNNQILLRHIRTGRRLGDWLEVLSGLEEGEEIALGSP